MCLLAVAFVCNLLWDSTRLDLATALPFGGPDGFPLRDAWYLTAGLHTGGLIASWAVASALCIGVWFPCGPLARLDAARRLQLAITPMLAVLAVSALKAISATSCPWDLTVFGGVARLVSHWTAAGGGDGGPGHCFPAGHASAGFMFIGGYFVFREEAPRIARAWLLSALTAGFVLGGAQQLRGAHFMSHTLWTAWICACVAWAVEIVFAGLRAAAMTPDPLAVRREATSAID
jgi:membrane-associated PAP2 superfamily phosphatase